MIEVLTNETGWIGSAIKNWEGESGETKPTATLNHTFWERDTAKLWKANGTIWEDVSVATFQALTEKGAANGYAELDAGGLVPVAQLPAGGTGDMLKSENLSGLVNYATARTNLELGSIATHASTEFANSTHVHSASGITSSTLALARLGGGTTNVSTFLNGTGNFSQPVYASIASLPTLGTAASTDALDYLPANRVSTIRTSNIAFTTTTSSLPMTGFGFTVSSTISYSFEFGLVYAAAISSTGLRIGLQYPATSSFAANVEIPVLVATGFDSRVQGYIITSGSSVVAPGSPLSSTKYIAFIKGQILPSANGTLQFCYATEVAGSAVSSFAGSYGILTVYP